MEKSRQTRVLRVIRVPIKIAHRANLSIHIVFKHSFITILEIKT